MSRSYDLLAWIGFLFALINLQRILSFSKMFKYSVFYFYILFTLLMLAEHTILHPEDRFGLILIPCSIVYFIKNIEDIIEKFQLKLNTVVFAQISLAVVFALLFVGQVIAWDNTSF